MHFDASPPRVLAQIRRCVYPIRMRNGFHYRATNLKAVILSQGKTKRSVAAQVGVSESHFHRVAEGERLITKAKAEEIAAVLGIPLFLLFEFTDVNSRVAARTIAA